MHTKHIMRLMTAAVVLALVAGCGKSAAKPAKPAATNAIVTMGDMVLIPTGPFAMGNRNPLKPTLVERLKAFVQMKPQPQVLDNDRNEVPVHTVMVSAFYMDKYEVTKGKWDEVYTWATNHGYAFQNPGKGKAPEHPVQIVNWYDCVKWCNARSEKEGLTPCYYADETKTEVYRKGQTDLANEGVNWATNGYRLPTEAEWEKAARGGTAGRRFPWGNIISHREANYRSDATTPYDKSETREFHPKFAVGEEPYTSPVGSFAPNGYGLHDMAGNVWEWCWDWYDELYYASSPGSDPHGPASGTYRVLRGGGWYVYARGIRCANRIDSHPGNTQEGYYGFRCVRGL